MPPRRFIQCDVFTSVPTKGNGLAVVVDGAGLSDQAMQGFAAWTNLAETTFLMPPAAAEADYKVRIFTPSREMPFAGHPTLGSCAAWLHCGGKPKVEKLVRQECGVGIVDIDLNGTMPAFAAPKTTVAPLPDDKRQAIIAALGLAPERILATALLSNGPVWQVFELKSAIDVLAVDSSKIRYPQFPYVGLIGAHPAGAECDYEVRLLAPSSGMSEDPITGSLNAAIARWKYGTGAWQRPVTVAQGTRIGRSGRVFIRYDRGTDNVWIGGQTCILIEGAVTL
ncbi:MAG TPA: PhzF family phenazine biosynthesis protein [Rhizomicrobium sp.]|jgi:PhzF family phenazine biosynthesis protein|nr:PhzF family phenazine biosynthesis protein [Rhizomicrobium sp.]